MLLGTSIFARTALLCCSSPIFKLAYSSSLSRCTTTSAAELLSRKFSMEKRIQPVWKPPTPTEPIALPEITLFNSLSSQKERFVPQQGKLVKWYTCGPTVYDWSHMGHARTYIAFDVLRRIFRDYFLFDVLYVLNITDIDDKIIKRARQNHLLAQYCADHHSLADTYNDVAEGIRNLKMKSTTDPDPDKRAYFQNECDRLVSLLSSKPPEGEDAVSYLIDHTKDALADMLDSRHGASITDHKIFESLSRKFESEFHSDMNALNVQYPDVLVRVTEHIDPIIRFVERIISNGFAYVAPSGSVYFDTNAFAGDPKHFYAKLVPTAYGDTEQLATGEGELTSGGEKRSANDFALWKSSKFGEPAWPSPWGPGRPGWHIECSVMASGILGDSIDIHGGGVDLKFPHHDNELAQSEACFGHSNWVHYFLHSGHLTISGCKMSKSLKNFVTIRDALKQYSARRLRLMFLLHSWRDTMDYGPDTLAETAGYEKSLIDFLYNATSLHLLAKECGSSSPAADSLSDTSLLVHLKRVQFEVYDALCDSCDTRRAMSALRDLISIADQYALVQISPHLKLVDRTNQVFLCACFILRVLRVLGVADLTSASSGTPVPVGAVVAGGIVSLEANPLQLDAQLPSDPSNLLSRSWLSLDAPTADVLASAVHLGLKAAQNLGHILLTEGGIFAEIAKAVDNELQTTFNLDMMNPPQSPLDCLDKAVRCVTNRALSAFSTSTFDLETHVWPVVFNLLFRIVSMRHTVRTQLLSSPSKDKALKQRLMAACDQMRDVDLVDAGVRLQDPISAVEPSIGITRTPCLGLVDPKILRAEVHAKTKKALEKKTPKTRGKPADVESPSEMFLKQSDMYSAFDAKGMPTHDAEGKPLSKSQTKKLQKLYDAQAKRYDASLRSNTELVNGS